MSDSSDGNTEVEAADLAEEAAAEQNQWVQWPDFQWWWEAIVHNEAEGVGPMDARGRAGYFLTMYAFLPAVTFGYLFTNITHPPIRPVLAGGWVVFALTELVGVVLVLFSLISDVFRYLKAGG